MQQHPVSKKYFSWKLIIPIPILGLLSVPLFYLLGTPLKTAILENMILDICLICFIILAVIRIILDKQEQEQAT